MVVADEQTIYLFAGNGTQILFTFGFTVPQDDERRLFVLLRNNSTFEFIKLILGTDYDVEFTPGDPGGDIVMAFAPATGFNLEVYRDEATPQDIEDNDFYTKNQRESGDDNLARVTKENRDQIRHLDNLFGNSDEPVVPPETPPLVPSPTQSNTYLVSDISGTPTWEEQPIVVLKPEAAEATSVLVAGAGGTTSWQQDLYFDGTTFIKRGAKWIHDVGGVLRSLGLDFTIGTYDDMEISIDNSDLPPNPVLGIAVNGGTVKLEPVENTGGIEATDPIPGRFTKFKDDNSIESTDMLETDQIDEGLNTAIALSLATRNRFTFYKTAEEQVKIGATEGKFYLVDWDLPEDAQEGDILKLAVDAPTKYRIIAEPAPTTELWHVNDEGGTPENVPTFLGHQEVDAKKYVEDSALTNRAGTFSDLDLTSVTYKRCAITSANTVITAGVLTVDLALARTFFAVLDQDVTSIVILNYDVGSDFALILETLAPAVSMSQRDISWTQDFRFPDDLQWQSTSLTGEIDVLHFDRLTDFWLVEQAVDSAILNVGDVVVINGDLLGNVKTISGNGVVVEATGMSYFGNDGTANNFLFRKITYKRLAVTPTPASIVSGVVSIDVLLGNSYDVSVDENITEINVNANFDRSKTATFGLFLEETAAGFAYNFGSEFIYDESTFPEESIAGGFKRFLGQWEPALQKWHTYTQQ